MRYSKGLISEKYGLNHGIFANFCKQKSKDTIFITFLTLIFLVGKDARKRAVIVPTDTQNRQSRSSSSKSSSLNTRP